MLDKVLSSFTKIRSDPDGINISCLDYLKFRESELLGIYTKYNDKMKKTGFFLVYCSAFRIVFFYSCSNNFKSESPNVALLADVTS